MSKLNNLKMSVKGFTIVETLIVLVIAAIIIIIVLLAVPALVRERDNTTIRTDANAVAATVQGYVTNNSGNIPTCIGNQNGSLTVSSGAITGGNDSNTQTCAAANNGATPPVATDTVQKGSINGGTLINTIAAAGAIPTAANIVGGTLYIGIHSDCNGTVGGDPRATAIYYPSNTGSGKTVQCVQA